ncbi:MAG: MFS transporter, partial [Halioglobus sp.]|nr:MFS transporter [Halioglobus sp.]
MKPNRSGLVVVVLGAPYTRAMTRSIAQAHPPAGIRAIRSRLGAVVASHLLVDVYSAFVPPLLGLLEVRCQLSAAETAWLLGLGSMTSGLSQPLSAWISDRTDSRLLGAVGLAIAALCLSSIGLAQSFWPLVLLYGTGMLGVGIYHPVGAATMGQLSSQGPRTRRSLGLSIFFVAGMAGGITGAIVASRAGAHPGGLDQL